MQSIGKKKTIHLTNLNLNKVLKCIIRTFFSFFNSELQKKKESETYADFRTDFLHDESGRCCGVIIYF